MRTRIRDLEERFGAHSRNPELQALRQEIATAEAPEVSTALTSSDEAARQGPVHEQEEPGVASDERSLNAPNAPDNLDRSFAATRSIYDIGQGVVANAPLVNEALSRPRPERPQAPGQDQPPASASQLPAAQPNPEAVAFQPAARQHAIPIIDPATGRPIGGGESSGGQGRGQGRGR